MPAFAHIGVGFAAKKILPSVNVVLLIIAAEFIEIVFMILWGIGIEHPPTESVQPFSTYSHSILAGLAWPLIAGVIIYLISRDKKFSIIIGLLVLSHFVLDFIASPKTAFYTADTGMPWFNNYETTYGLGLWSNTVVAWIGELGIFVTGLIIYVITTKRNRAAKKHFA